MSSPGCRSPLAEDAANPPQPGVPTDRAHIETLFGHVMGEWPELEHVTDSGVLDRALDRVRFAYNSVRLHADRECDARR